MTHQNTWYSAALRVIACQRHIMAAAVLVLCSPVLSAQDQVLDAIVAVVNEGVVLSSDLTAETKWLKQEAASSGQTLPDSDVLQDRVLQRLIEREIQRQHATRLGISVDATSVNRAIERVAQGNNLNALQFRNALRSQGVDYEQFRNNIEQELLIGRLVQRDVEPRIRVSGQEIDDYLDAAANDAAEQQRNRISHILVAVANDAKAEENQQARARAERIVAELDDGADFAQVAANQSDGPRALQGGDLGWRTLRDLPGFLATALRSMQVGDVSPVLTSENGFHVVKLIDQQSSDNTVQAETLVRHIFLNGSKTDAQQQMQRIRQQLDAGAEFAKLANEFSDDPNSASNGGELPWFTPGQLPETLESVASQLPIGEVSQPFQTPFGWHVLEVMERRERKVSTQAQRQTAEGALRQRKVEQETIRWMQRLRDESYVEVRG